MDITSADIEDILLRDNPEELDILFSDPEVQALARSTNDFLYRMSLAVWTIHYGSKNARDYVFRYIEGDQVIYTEMLCDLISMGVSYEGIDFLLQKGALIDGTSNRERIPLFTAFATKSFNTVQHLVRCGANLYVLDNKKRSLLQYTLEWYTDDVDDEDNEVITLRSIGYKNISDSLLLKNTINETDEKELFDPFE
jgi:hypothetical protein